MKETETILYFRLALTTVQLTLIIRMNILIY